MTLAELTARGVRVKPLEWAETNSEIPRHAWETWTTFGRWVIVAHFVAMNSAVYRWQGDGHPTLEAAKAAAQAYYETRILSALTTGENDD